MGVEKTLTGGCLFAAVGLAVSTIPAWITHIVVCIRSEEYVFLVAGALMPPIGVIHGWGVWFGWW